MGRDRRWHRQHAVAWALALWLVVLRGAIFDDFGSATGYVLRLPRRLSCWQRSGHDRLQRFVGRRATETVTPSSTEVFQQPQDDLNDTDLMSQEADSQIIENRSELGLLGNAADGANRSNETEVLALGMESEPEPMATWPISVVAGLGAIDCGYLTYVKLSSSPLACPAGASEACTKVLSSPYASIGPIPLALVGFAAYGFIIALNSSDDNAVRQILWWLCFALALTSLGLMALLILQLHLPCAYCATSAFISACLLTLVEVNTARSQNRASRRTVLVLSAVVALAALRGGTLPTPAQESWWALASSYKPDHPPVRSSSSEAEKALARHLTQTGAACYTAWWCPHCQDQREDFGSQAVALAPFVQCSAVNQTQLPLCKEKNIESYPTWIINGTQYRGGRSLSDLAKMSGFTSYPPDAFKSRDEEAKEYIWGPRENDIDDLDL